VCDFLSAPEVRAEVIFSLQQHIVAHRTTFIYLFISFSPQVWEIAAGALTGFRRVAAH